MEILIALKCLYVAIHIVHVGVLIYIKIV